MITVDLHIHTHYSHALDSVTDMFCQAKNYGLEVIGFSEHSPRPLGYDYPSEYRDKLSAGFVDYLNEVRNLKSLYPDLTVLLGLEVDWFEAETDFIKQTIEANDFDYLIAGTHFLQHWPFDSMPNDWDSLNLTACSKYYEQYFKTLVEMAKTGWFDITAHPDIIKIFSVDIFHTWLQGDNLDLVRDALVAIKDNNMAMEVSSAGLRKACKEIYPCPKIMAMAADLGLDISFASDAHAVDHIGYAFPELAAYAASFGYDKSVYFCKKNKIKRSFI